MAYSARIGPNPYWVWDFRLSDGSPAPGGGYFINTEWLWEDGSRDTTWIKEGYIRADCAG